MDPSPEAHRPAARTPRPAPLFPAFAAFLAVRFLFARRINLIGVVGIAVGVWALIVVVAVFSGFISDIRGGIRQVSPDLLLTEIPSDASFEQIDAVLRADADVVATAPRLRYHALYFKHGAWGSSSGVRTSSGDISKQASDYDFVELIGIDPSREVEVTDLLQQVLLPQSWETRSPEELFEIPGEMIQVWRSLEGFPLGPGEAIGSRPAILFGYDRFRRSRVEIPQQLSLASAHFPGDLIDGAPALHSLSKDVHVGAPFHTGHRVFDETKALLTLDVLRDDFLGYDRFLDPDVVSDVAIRVRPDADLETVKQRLADALAADEGLQKAYPEGFGGLILTWEEQNEVYLDAVDQERAMMKIVLFAVMLVAAFLVYATLHMLVTQKTREIGVLTAMGASSSGVLKIFLSTGGVIALLGCGLGVATGLASVFWMNDLDTWTQARLGFSLFPRELYALDEIPYSIEPWWVVQVALGALAVSAVAAWLPARRAAHLQPVRALAHE